MVQDPLASRIQETLAASIRSVRSTSKAARNRRSDGYDLVGRRRATERVVARIIPTPAGIITRGRGGGGDNCQVRVVIVQNRRGGTARSAVDVIAGPRRRGCCA